MGDGGGTVLNWGDTWYVCMNVCMYVSSSQQLGLNNRVGECEECVCMDELYVSPTWVSGV